MIHRFLSRLAARRRLARDVEKRASSYEIRRFAERRAAAKKGWAHRQADRAFVNGAASVSTLRASIPCAEAPQQ